MIQNKIIKYSSWSILLISIGSISSYLADGTGLNIVRDTTLWWIIDGFILYTLWRAKKLFFDSKADKENMYLVLIYLLWNLFSIFRGLFIADNYWDWKGLVSNAAGILLPIVAYSASNLIFTQAVLSYYLIYALPLFIVFAPFISKDSYGFYLVPISFLMLFFPLYNLRAKLLLFAVTLVIVFADFDARSNVIKFVVPFLLLGLLFIKNTLLFRLLELLRNILFIAPFLLLFLASLDIFNPFKIEKYTNSNYQQTKKNENGQDIQVNLSADTRTAIYFEVINTAKKYNSWIIGRSPARGNESELFASSDLTGRKERLYNEVAILNIFTWTGIVGVLLYMLVFYLASYLAVNKSNNAYAKIMGIYISFRWVYAWVEDINTFTLTTFMLWLIIGLAFSNSFRKLSNREILFWVRGIFEKKYRFAYYKQLRKLKVKSKNLELDILD